MQQKNGRTARNERWVMNRTLVTGMMVCFSGFAIVVSGQDFGRWTQVADQISNIGNQAGVIELLNTTQTLRAHCGNQNNPTNPPRGDGRIPLPPSTSTPPVAPPGYVWIGDHWERVKAPVQPPVNPRPTTTTGGQNNRDHRSNPPVVHDHRNQSPNVRDHRNSDSSVRDHRGGR